MDPQTPLPPYVPPAGNQPLQPVGSPGSPPPFATPPAAPAPSNFSSFPGASAQAAPAGNQVLNNQPFTPPPAYIPPTAALPPESPIGAQQAAPVAQAPAGPSQQVTEQLRLANNVLVTVSNNPSVDQLSAAIGLTLLLNKLNKHATAVFSGEVPSTLEFLQPEKTIEKNTDSLRDFIIALDKAKADKLRYKVEDKFVKIFITPYHTSLSEDDLEFSQGDFNVDVVIALGVHKREELDQAITAHGRILHDAAVACVNNKQTAELGSINWFDPSASSLSEMLVGLIQPLQGKQVLLDEQIATAFLTGIVAETERFSNDKTSPQTMNISATLMKAGANQQLVASKLQAPAPLPQAGGQPGDAGSAEPTKPAKSSDGSLEIEHKKDEPAPLKTLEELEQANKDDDSVADEGQSDLDKIHIDDQGRLQRIAELEQQKAEAAAEKTPLADQPPQVTSNMILEPPKLGSALSANTVPETSPPPVNPMMQPSPSDASSMQHGKPLMPIPAEEKPAPEQGPQTLAQLEAAVDSPHLESENTSAILEAARNKINDAQDQMEPEKPTPDADLNALPIELDAKPDTTAPQSPTNSVIPPDPGPPADPTAGTSPTAPPPLPPPLMPPT